jgi:hypothetical protein
LAPEFILKYECGKIYADSHSGYGNCPKFSSEIICDEGTIGAHNYPQALLRCIFCYLEKVMAEKWFATAEDYNRLTYLQYAIYQAEAFFGGKLVFISASGRGSAAVGAE